MGFDIEIVKRGGTYTSCRDLHWGIVLTNPHMLNCCMVANGNYDIKDIDSCKLYPFLFPNINRSIDFNEEFFEKLYRVKLDYVRRINDGEEFICTECPGLLHKEWEPMPKLKLNRFVFASDYTCNSNCIYCNQTHNEKSCYDVLDFINQGEKLGYIDTNNVYVAHWAGGEPVLMENYEELFNRLSSNVRFYNRTFTTAIKFSEPLAQLLSVADCGKVEIHLSIDSGNRETYKKVKRVDQFDRVVENFDEYYKVAKVKNNLILKYIFLEENCSEQDVDDFLNLIRSKGWHGIRVIISIDFLDDSIFEKVRAGISYMALKAPFYTGAPVINLIDSGFAGTKKLMNNFSEKYMVDELSKLGQIKLLAEQNGLSLDEVVELVKNNKK